MWLILFLAGAFALGWFFARWRSKKTATPASQQVVNATAAEPAPKPEA